MTLGESPAFQLRNTASQVVYTEESFFSGMVLTIFFYGIPDTEWLDKSH